ncbi:MAG: TMEM165/GDT1 family protein, partial [Candidatus Heimdallarchaeota archaeon]
TLDFEILKPLIAIIFLGIGLIILANELQKRKKNAIRICPVSLDLCDKPKENCSEMGNCELYLNAEVRKGAFIRSTAFMFFAELGDKTMLMGLGLATQLDPIGVFFGAILALSFVNAMGVFAGDRIARKLPITLLGIISGILFLITGFFILIL